MVDVPLMRTICPDCFLQPGVNYRAAIFEKDPANANNVITEVQTVNSTTVLKPSLTANSGYSVRLTQV